MAQPSLAALIQFPPGGPCACGGVIAGNSPQHAEKPSRGGESPEDAHEGLLDRSDDQGMSALARDGGACFGKPASSYIL